MGEPSEPASVRISLGIVSIHRDVYDVMTEVVPLAWIEDEADDSRSASLVQPINKGRFSARTVDGERPVQRLKAWWNEVGYS